MYDIRNVPRSINQRPGAVEVLLACRKQGLTLKLEVVPTWLAERDGPIHPRKVGVSNVLCFGKRDEVDGTANVGDPE